MTDNTNEPDTTPEQPNVVPTDIPSQNASAEPAAAAPVAPVEPVAAPAPAPAVPVEPAAVAPVAPQQPAAAQPVVPQQAAPASPPPPPVTPPVTPAAPVAPAAEAAATGATAAYPTDSFGRPLYADAGAGGNGVPTDPNQPQAAAAAPRRRGGAMLVAALAIGAIVGGATGAGVVALANSGQTTSNTSNQSQGAANIVVNNTQSVNDVTAVAAKASPSVVTINVSSTSEAGTGSGVILSDDGYILTNTHVVTLDGAVSGATIKVTLTDGSIYDATVIGTDPISDLAVIKLTNASGLTPIDWADSSKINVGDTTVAIGAPLGLAGTVTTGIVSALNRSITVASSAAPTTPDQTTPNPNSSQGPFDYYFDQGNGNQGANATSSVSLSVIQTDAAINPGNSGGALLNSKGELIGINVAIANASSTSSTAGSIGVGFALPSDLAKRISEELISTGTATHGLLGASVGDASSDPSSTTVGALVASVVAGGPAASAGLAKGDIITNFNGLPITDATDLTAQVRALAAGSKAEVTYVRGGNSKTVEVTLGSLSS